MTAAQKIRVLLPLSPSLAHQLVSLGETHEEIEVNELDPTAPLSYEAIEGALLVRYLDDCCHVALSGWSLRAIQAVANGLNQRPLR